MRLIGTAALALIAALSFSSAAAAKGGGHSGHSTTTSSTKSPGDHVVSGYTKKDGTVVAPYHATNPNETRNDNYSTRGNVNPYTGKEGTKPRDGGGPK